MKFSPCAFAVLTLTFWPVRAQDSAPSGGTPGHSFICGDYTAGKLDVVDATGAIVWQTDAPNCNDLWALPNGNLLFNTGHGVKEMTRDKKVVFDYESPSSIYACQRLANGETFVGECDAARLLLISPEGKIDHAIKLLPEGVSGGGAFMRNARYLPNGHYLVALYGGNAVKEYDEIGQVVWQVAVPGGAHSVVRLPNGNTLVAVTDHDNNPGVEEFDPSGKVVWEISNQDIPGAPLKFITGLQRLPNGNTVFSNWLGHGHLGSAPHIFEVTPDKKVVWSYVNPRMMAIGNVELTDVPGDCLKGEIWH